MQTGLALTIAIDPNGGDGRKLLNREALDAVISGLICDLNSIDSVRAAQVTTEAPVGSKAVGTILLGVLQAEVSVTNAIKVVRFLKARLLDGTPQPPIRLKLSRTASDGSVTAVELEGTASDEDAIKSLLSRLEACVELLNQQN